MTEVSGLDHTSKLMTSSVGGNSPAFLFAFDLQGDADGLVFFAADEFAKAGQRRHRTTATESLCAVAGARIKPRGDIAITWDHDMHLYFERAHGSAHLPAPTRELPPGSNPRF